MVNMARITYSIALIYFGALTDGCAERYFKHTTQLFAFKCMGGGTCKSCFEVIGKSGV